MKQNHHSIKTYDKIGGWLFLFNISFIISILNNLLIKPTIFFSLNQSFKILSFRSNILFIVSDVFIIIGNLMIFPTIGTYFLFLIKSYSFPKWFMIFRTMNFSFLFIGTIISIQSNSHSISAQEITNINSLILNLLSILLIFPYLIFSKRVKGTFRREENSIILENNYMAGRASCSECAELNVNKMVQIGLTECPKCGRALFPQVLEIHSSNDTRNEIEINNKREH